MSAVRLRDGKGPPRESRRGSGSGRRLPSLEAPSETTRRARECVPRSARDGVRPPRGFRNLLPGKTDKTDAAHVANSSKDEKTRSRCRRRCGQPAARVTTLRARVSQHVLRRLPNRRRRRRRARDPPRLPQGARFVRARDPRALGRVFPRDPSARIAHRRAARGGGRRDPRARPRARGTVLPRAQRRRRGQGRTDHRHHHRCVPNTNGPPRRTSRSLSLGTTWRISAKPRDARARTRKTRSFECERRRDSNPVLLSIPTGVVSVALAVGYLALVQVIDSREMLPPPPEAMGMGECPPGERRC